MHFTGAISLGSVLSIITIVGALATLVRWGKKISRITEVPDQLDKINANLRAIEKATNDRHEQNQDWQQRHIMQDHRPRQPRGW